MQQGTNLEKLRIWMHKENVQAMHVPREDMFNGEYVASCDERLAWVSNFTGSAGFAIITQDNAYLFVDGRYTLQAKSQSTNFIIHNLRQDEIDKVCETIITLHYDTWLMSVQQQQHWQQRVNLIALDYNPIDNLWDNRPAPTHIPAWDYPVTYAGKTREEKIKIIKNNAWFLSDPESVCWLLNIRGNDLPYVPVLHCMALVTKNSFTLFCEPSKISKELLQKLNVKVLPFESMANELKALNTQINADKRTTPSALLQSGILFDWQPDPLLLQKAKKNPTEQQGMRNCHVRDGAAVMRFWMWIEQQTDITEIDAQEHLEICRQKIDLHQGASFATISGFGAHGAIVHYRAEPLTNLKITKGIYLLDSGGQYLDGTTDITRTFSISEPTQEQRIHYTLVLKGHIALANIHFPKGTTGAQLDILARQYLWNSGLDYAHGTGHGVGSYLNVHEGPQGISKARNAVLEPGMVVSNEPGLYIENEYGIRIENLQMVKESNYDNFLCFESLTMVPYEKALIEKSLLTKQELNWLECYYQAIWTNISPLLNDEEKNWLQNKIETFVPQIF